MIQKKTSKEMPFTKDDYFKQLDNMLTMPGQAPLQTGIQKIADLGKRLRLSLPKLPKV